MSALLFAVRGALAGQRFPIADQPIIFGRAPDCQIVVGSNRASRHHARLSHTPSGYLLEDLGSSNGTLVNGQRVQSWQLHPGDLIEIGDDLFRFEASAATQDATIIGVPPPAPPPVVPPPPVMPPPAASVPPPLPQVPPAYASPSPATQPVPQVPPLHTPPAAPPKRGGAGCVIGLLAGLVLICVLLAGGVYLFRDQLAAVAPLPPGVITGNCAPELAGDWDVQLTLRETDDPDSQDSIGETNRGVANLDLRDNESILNLNNLAIEGTCRQSGPQITIEGAVGSGNDRLDLRFTFNRDNPDRLSGTMLMKSPDYSYNADIRMTR